MMEIDIRGVQKTSLLDYPKRMCTTIFTNGCNMRCPFCHNSELALGTYEGKAIPPEELLDFLWTNRKWKEAVCITGGEPCLQPGLIDFCRHLKELKFLVKIDSNGTMPNILKQLIDEKLVDFIAMDIKSSPDKYNTGAGIKVDMEKINESIQLIINSGVDYEFRTTVVPGIVDQEDIKKIGEWLKGTARFAIQQYHNDDLVLSHDYQHTRPYLVKDLENMANVAKPYFDDVIVRGI